MTSERDRQDWSDHSRWWVDEFTDGADPEYEEQILPLAAAELAGYGRVLDVGCGEGQLSRLVATPRSMVIGIDPTAEQLRVASERGGGPIYVRAAVGALPFPSDSFDAVVMCLVMEHIDDVAGVLGEISRVLDDGGRFCWFLNHPLFQTPGSGWIYDHVLDPPEQYWRVGPYLEAIDHVETVQPGVHVRFVHRPLSAYVNGLAGAGFALEWMYEPAPPPGFLSMASEYAAAAAIPRLLYLRATKRTMAGDDQLPAMS